MDRAFTEDPFAEGDPAEAVTKSALRAWQGDITELSVDAIVNAANRSLMGGGGVDGAIHRAAGPRLLEACRLLGGCETGEAVITKGYRLPARWVIHTVGPIYANHAPEEDARLLASCYTSSLDLAREFELHSIAFPAISTGVYGYPLAAATKVAVATVRAWLAARPDWPMEVIFCCFDARTLAAYDRELSA